MREFVNNFLEPISSLLPLVLLFSHFKEVRGSKELLLLLILFLSTFILTFTASLYAYLDTQNIWVYNLLCIAAFVFTSLYFISILKTPVNKKAVYFFLPVYGTFFLTYTYLLNHGTLFNSIAYAILSLLISSYSVLYFVEKLSLMEDTRLQDSYSFWVVTSFFVYYLGSFFIFLIYDHVTSAGITIGKLWGVHNIIYFISSAIAAFGLWKKPRVKFT